MAPRDGKGNDNSTWTEELSMSDNGKPTETETVLMALDQISQTIDVMTSVVNRLRNYVQQQQLNTAEASQEASSDLQADRILH